MSAADTVGPECLGKVTTRQRTAQCDPPTSFHIPCATPDIRPGQHYAEPLTDRQESDEPEAGCSGGTSPARASRCSARRSAASSSTGTGGRSSRTAMTQSSQPWPCTGQVSQSISMAALLTQLSDRSGGNARSGHRQFPRSDRRNRPDPAGPGRSKVSPAVRAGRWTEPSRLPPAARRRPPAGRMWRPPGRVRTVRRRPAPG